MRILVSNDDGINAPGLKVLERIAHELSDDVWVVAPETEQSGASHSLTLHDPLRLRQVNDQKYAVRGTPTDCVMMGVKHVLDEAPPDLILSGVNRGSNIAEDVTYSGTIAAAMEGTVLGIRSIALSQAYGFEGHKNVKWACAEHHGAGVVSSLISRGWPKGILMNVNFPDRPFNHVEGLDITVQGRRDQSNATIDARVDARGVDYFWLGFSRRLSQPAEGTDLYAIYNGRISVTPLHMNLTHDQTRDTLIDAFKDYELDAEAV